jgi:hypothetical protein
MTSRPVLISFLFVFSLQLNDSGMDDPVGLLSLNCDVCLISVQ